MRYLALAAKAWSLRLNIPAVAVLLLCRTDSQIMFPLVYCSLNGIIYGNMGDQQIKSVTEGNKKKLLACEGSM